MKFQYKKFADGILLGMNHIDAYMKAYPKAKRASARTKSVVLLRNVEVSRYIQEKNDKIQQIKDEKVAEKLEKVEVGNFLTRERKRELLWQIANGTFQNEIKKPVWNNKANSFQIITVYEPPSDNARMKAVEIDNRMMGENQDNVQVTGKNGGPIEVYHSVDFGKLDINIRAALLIAAGVDGAEK